MEQQNSSRKRGKGGRPPKIDPAKFRYSVNFTEEEHARFLTMYEQSGLLSKAQFIKARVFDATFRVIKKDRGTMEFAARLTTFNALAMLYKLENETRNLVAVGEKIIALAEEFRQRW